jgi:hypothetical protein
MQNDAKCWDNVQCTFNTIYLHFLQIIL